MSNKPEPVAKRIQGNLVEYVCPRCGGWDGLCEVYRSFLPFVDHLIEHLCLAHLPQLSRPFVMSGLMGDHIWFRKPGKNDIIPGLPHYSPDSPEWRELLERGQKILPQAKFFLPDVADWLAKPLA